MNKVEGLSASTARPEVKEQLKLQIAQYLEQQPESKRAFHQWMKRLEAAGVGVILVAFGTALYLSIAWKSVNPLTIPIAWFAFAASAGPLFMLIGLHSVVLRAFPPIVIPGYTQKLVTGSAAVWPGWGSVVLGLVLILFWGIFAYATWIQNWALLTPLISFLGVVMGVGMTISILYAMFQKIIKSR